MERIDKTFKLFVGNLPPTITSEQLRVLFEPYGRVVECRIFNNYKNVNANAYVHMESEECGRNAILLMNSRMVGGKCISVEESKQKDGPSVPSTRLRVRNVPHSMTAKELRLLFSTFGAVLSVEIKGDEGIVTIEAVADIRSAIDQINGHLHDGQGLIVEPIINTSIKYNPKQLLPKLMPPSKNHESSTGSTSSTSEQFNLNQMSPGPGEFFRPPFRQRPETIRMGRPYPIDEGKVLRDPYAARVAHAMGEPQSMRPKFRPDQAPQPLFMKKGPSANLEPLFFKRNEFLRNENNDYRREKPAFHEDTPFYGAPAYDPPPAPPVYHRVPGNRPQENARPSQFLHNPQPQPLFSNHSSLVRRNHVPQADPGEAYQVPAMIAPGSFQPPKKYVSNRSKKRKKKKASAEPKPQRPIPEEPKRLIPDFSEYYRAQIPGSVLKPYPPPLFSSDHDFAEDGY